MVQAFTNTQETEPGASMRSARVTETLSLEKKKKEKPPSLGGECL